MTPTISIPKEIQMPKTSIVWIDSQILSTAWFDARTWRFLRQSASHV